MGHDTISVLLLGGLMYIIYAIDGIAVNVKKYIFVNDFLKYILGFFLFKGNKFSIKSIIMQSGNLSSILIYFILSSFLGTKVSLSIFIGMEGINLLITFIASFFINR